jgi:hypothetical protein
MSTLSYHEALAKAIRDIEDLLKDEGLKKIEEEGIITTNSMSQSTKLQVRL